MAKYTIEVYGVSLPDAGQRQVELELEPEVMLGDLLAALGRKAPGLAGRILGPDGRSLRPPYVMNINGLAFVEDFSLKAKAGDRILLMAPPAGG